RNRICAEALALLDECDGSLRHLRGEPDARHAVHRMFRAVHTIKGSTRGTRLRAVSQLAHEIEEALDIIRRSDDAVPVIAIDHIDHELRRVRAEVTLARPRGETDDAMTELAAECRPAIAELRATRTGITRRQPDAIAGARRAIARIVAAAGRAKMRALGLQAMASRNALEIIADGG